MDRPRPQRSGAIGRRARLFAALALGAHLAACSRPYEGPYRHVLLLSLDTTRADHLGAFSGGAFETPALDRLAKEGLRFVDATSTAPTTLSAHASIFTGTWPHTHGVVRNGFRVHADNVMLAEVLRAAGFTTAGFLGSFALESRFDLDQGFDWWDERFGIEVDGRTYEQNQRGGEAVTDAVLAYLDRPDVDRTERQFLFAHYFDAHTPYNPPEPWNRRYLREGGRAATNLVDVDEAVAAHERALGFGRSRRMEEGLQEGLVGKVTGAPIGTLDEDLAALYAGEVAFLDAQVARLLEGLDLRGMLDECVVVVVADHGETFWEHADFWNHGLCVYDTTVRVPLVLHLPDGRGAGRIVETPVSTIDVLPTLLELLELPVPERCEGVSLVAALDGGAVPARPIFSEATQPARRWDASGAWPNLPNAAGVREGSFKYVRTPYLDGLEELYDLASDPLEQVDLLARDPEAHAPRVARLRALLDAWRDSARPLRTELDMTQQRDTLRRLRELGYVGGGPDDPPLMPPSGPATPRELESPHVR